ncbi:hypothetical protein [Marimonas lutisalis]|uniref:hypothetical protein n=1 Tax=Marimonas lutisalis TaxID=2545756 RepID=UPI0010F94F0F|nr:hypothetical protein [Marimonas lutisalis]
MVAQAKAIAAEIEETKVIPGHATSGYLSAIVGTALCAAALGLWFVPGANWDPALMLVKLGMSGFFLGGGAMFILAARRKSPPEVILDGRRGRLTLIQHDIDGAPCATEVNYDDLSEVDFREGMLIARNHHGQPVVEMPVEHAGDLDEIRAALGPAFARSA